MQLIKDNKENCEAVNKALDAIGYKMGIKMVDEFLLTGANKFACKVPLGPALLFHSPHVSAMICSIGPYLGSSDQA